ncbi:maoC dehydratase domain protein [Brucella thiophenivorans]|uniref:MaoC dehydratase domain protein n=1 Tax=Brucella thiophenivorans TaxID=571255 RepID=A0A256FNF6_9HYPH|nr:maoC dehydratase domain protein [Brucella thiophenivorans]
MRFIVPTFIGDTIRVRSTIIEKRDHKRPEQGLVVEQVEVLKQDDSLALICNHIHIVTKKEV